RGTLREHKSYRQKVSRHRGESLTLYNNVYSKTGAAREINLGIFHSAYSQNPVKPPNCKSPIKTHTFAWRTSFPPTAIIEVEKKSPGQVVGAFYSAVKPLQTGVLD